MTDLKILYKYYLVRILVHNGNDHLLLKCVKN